MKKKLFLMLACVLCSMLVFTACSGDNKELNDEAAETETVETEAVESEVTQADIEENIIGLWMMAERDGQPVPTSEKGVYDFESDRKAYISASLTSNPDAGEQWMDRLAADVSIDGNEMVLMCMLNDNAMAVEEFDITDINANEFSAKHKVAISNGSDNTLSEEVPVRFVKVSDDFSKDIHGTWEGRCTSEGSEFDDGQDHRWEYKDDGTYVYYVKDGGKWVPGEDTMNEYFVAGNLLCTRWNDGDKENREWWEITIDGDKMNWTALREDKDGKTSTVTFEMTRVEE